MKLFVIKPTFSLDNCFNINFAEDDPYLARFKAGYCMEVPRSSGVNCKSPGSTDNPSSHI
ncbi:hypothetical protein DPMN_182508 [Dreissena polymorpha]|uniref:Uncharacterized protein n=1 Tax=Dreissena polymorpha TaxID=45954 RepID=A0A9D4DFK4_DREPO|nr:hypothetical protein DPMN_182508 [Dreissena polymorpha]